MREPTYAQISALAYQLYEEDGKPHGQAEIHWHRALDLLRHPETFSADNVLSPPSEPEINRTLDAKAQEYDRGLPSDPRSGPKAFHQHLEFASGGRKLPAIRKALRDLDGVEEVKAGAKRGTVLIAFDARKTNPAAIIETLTPQQETAAV